MGSAGRAAASPSDGLRGGGVGCGGVISSGTESFWGDRCVVELGPVPEPVGWDVGAGGGGRKP